MLGKGNKKSQVKKQPRMERTLNLLHTCLEETCWSILSISKTNTFLLRKESIQKPLSSAFCTDYMAFIFHFLFEKIGSKKEVLYYLQA